MTPEILPIDVALEQRPNLWHLFMGVITGATTLVKELDAANKLIARLEAGELHEELTATKAIRKVEQAILKMGDTSKSAKTIRVELLALLDKEYHQEVGKPLC